jgi:hypothetical protein
VGINLYFQKSATPDYDMQEVTERTDDEEDTAGRV